MPRCLFCNSEFAQKAAPEHVLLNALGGKMKTTRIVCAACNNKFGSSIDQALANEFLLIRNLFRMKTGDGKTAPTLKKIPIAMGEMNVRGDGILEFVAKPFITEKIGDGIYDVRITVPSIQDLNRWIPHISAETGIPESRVREQLANRKITRIEHPPGPTTARLSFGGQAAIRSAAKACLVLWALKVGIEEVSREPYQAARGYVVDGDDVFDSAMVALDGRDLDVSAETMQPYGSLYNLIYVRSNSDGKVVGHFTLFNLVAFRIVLAERGGIANQVTAVVSNPLDPSVWTRDAATLIDIPFAWLDASLDDGSLEFCLKERMARLLRTYYETFRPLEDSRISNAVARKHGLSDDDPIPAEVFPRYAAELADRNLLSRFGLPFEEIVSTEELKAVLDMGNGE